MVVGLFNETSLNKCLILFNNFLSKSHETRKRRSSSDGEGKTRTRNCFQLLRAARLHDIFLAKKQPRENV